MIVEDLDILRPTPRMVHLGGEDIDVSFIPCGVTFEVDKLVRSLATLDMEKVQEGGEETKKALDISIDLCAAFCTYKHPDFTPEWFRGNVDNKQIERFANAIKEALMKAYEGAQTDSKNAVAPKRKKK